MKVEPFELPELAVPQLHLRAWRASDVSAVQEASQDPYIPTITTVPTMTDPSEALAFVERQSARIRTRSAYVFAVADDSDSAVGHIGLFPLSTAGARASIGYWVLPSQRRRGYAAEALGILTAWARELDSLDRLELYVEPWNTGFRRAAESAGHEREGLLRSWERHRDGESEPAPNRSSRMEIPERARTRVPASVRPGSSRKLMISVSR